MFHAVSLDGDVEAAKVLAYSAPGCATACAGGERAAGADAVVNRCALSRGAATERTRDTERRSATVRRGRHGDAEIRVLTINDLARAAETARNRAAAVRRLNR